MKDSKQIHYIFLVLVLLLGIYGSYVNYKVLQEDTTPFIYDILNSYVISLKHYNYLEHGDLIGFAKHYLTKYKSDYPPFYMFQTFPFYMIMGVSEDAAAFSNIIHLFIMLFATYFIGKKIKNSYVGFLSAIILFFIPGTLPFSRVYLPDFGLTAFVMLSLVFFLYSDFFMDTKYSILFGIFVGLGMLIKYTFFIYVGIYLLIFFFNYFKRNNKIYLSKKQWKNLIIVFLIIINFMLLWYPKNILIVLSTIWQFNIHNTLVTFYGLTGVDFITTNFNLYIYVFVITLSWNFIYLIGLSMLYLILRRIFYSGEHNLHKTFCPYDLIFLIPCSLILFLIIFLNYHADPRYILFFFPLFGILTSAFLYDAFIFIYSKFLYERDFKMIFFIFLVLILILFNYNTISWMQSRDSKQIEDTFWEGILSPKNYTNKQNDIIPKINIIMGKINGTTILSLQKSETMDIVTFSSHLSDYYYNIPLFCLSNSLPITEDMLDPCGIPEKINCNYFDNFDLVIGSDLHLSIKSINNLRKLQTNNELINKILSKWEECKPDFELSDTITEVPILTNFSPISYTNSTIYLYTRKISS